MSQVRRLLIAALSLSAATQGARAQTAPASPLRGPTQSLLIERIVGEQTSLSILTVRTTNVRPGEVGTEITVAVPVPYAALLGAEAGPAFAIAMPGATLLLRGGVGGLLIAAVPEMYLGTGAMVRIGPTMGLRADAQLRYFIWGSHWTRVLSVDFGVSFLERSRPCSC